MRGVVRPFKGGLIIETLLYIQRHETIRLSASFKMISLGSISREDATVLFPFLALNYRGRRSAIREFTHRDPDFVFWISPNGLLLNARDSHLQNPPKGFEHILNDEPDYGGFLRGRVASLLDDQLIVVYCRAETLAHAGKKLAQFLRGVGQLPVLIRDDALVISDNGDIYGTLDDLVEREASSNIKRGSRLVAWGSV